MPFEALGNPLILIPGSIIAVLDILTFPLFILLNKSEHKDKIIYLLLFKSISIPACLYFAFTQFGEPYFMGAWYSLAVIIIPFYMLVVLFITASKLRKEHGSLRKRDKRQLITGLIIVLTIALPAILHMPVKNACTRADTARIPALTQALEDYHATHNAYSETLAELDGLPTPSCQFLSGKPRQFEARICPDAAPIFYVETVDRVGFDFFEAGTPNHWRIPSLMRRADPSACD